jgi:uracil-DNA glycosylase
MDGIADDELAGQLADLTRRLRDQLVRHAALGAWAAPGGATARTAIADADSSATEHNASDDAAPVVDDAEGMYEAAPARLAVPRDEPVAAGSHDQRLSSSPSPVSPVSSVLADAAALADAPAVDAPVPLGRRTLPEIRAELGECTRCKLHSTRRSIVFGVGAPDTPLMFVGEAPGEQEDRRGEPFVGAAGQLLDKMIEAMGWTRSAVYIANTTKCRPPGNRNPQPDELEQCMPFLHQQIAAIAPRIIVALGRPASNQLLGTDAPISALRGRFHDYVRLGSERYTCKVMPTFHPAYLLRDPDKKRAAWADLKLVMAELTRLGIAAPGAAVG